MFVRTALIFLLLVMPPFFAAAQSAAELPVGASVVVDGKVLSIKMRHVPSADKIDDVRCSLELKIESIEGGQLQITRSTIIASGWFRYTSAAGSGPTRVAKLGDVQVGSEVKLALKPAADGDYEILAPDGLAFVGPGS